MIDPSLFLPSAVDAETRRFVADIEERLANAPSITEVPPEKLRADRDKGESIFGDFVTSERAEDREIEGPGGRLPLRVIESAEPARAVYLHIHGGGWMLGAPQHHDLRLEAMADRLEIATVSVEYRLAPEDPYPAGPDDCEAAALWLVENAAAHFGTDCVMIGGESAGAHLSVVTLLRMRDRHDYSGFVAANLTYGVYDLAMTPSTAAWGDAPLVLSTPIIEWFADNFVPAELRRDPDVSPLFADLSGLPPALFTVGTLDPLLDDSLFMSQRWAAAGNQADLSIVPGGIHAFDYFDTPLAAGSNARADEFLESTLGVC